MALLRSHAIKAEETSRVRRDLLTTHTTNQSNLNESTEFLSVACFGLVEIHAIFDR